MVSLTVVASATAACGSPPPAQHPSKPKTVNRKPTATLPTYDPSAFQGGINLIVYGANPSYTELPAQMRSWHAWHIKDVAIVYPLYQSGVTSVDIGPGSDTPSLASLQDLIGQLQSGGFVVMMRPLLDEASLHNSWRGAIEPRSPAEWFANYDLALLSEATLAQEMHVAQFDIGTELSSLQGDSADWSALIAKLRNVFHGTLLYSCNWNDTTPEPWFSNLDVVGIDAYYPVQLPAGASADQISAALSQHSLHLPAFGKPIWITEAGVVPAAGSYQYPYEYKVPGRAYDPTEQAQYYQAFCTAFRPSVRGIFWWASDLGTTQANASSYNPTPGAGAAISACFASTSTAGGAQ